MVATDIKIILLIIGIGNGLFLSFTLGRLGAGKRASTVCLSLLLLTFTLLLATEILDITLNRMLVPLPLVLAIGPLTYLYIRSTAYSTRKLATRDLVHGLPTALSLLFFVGIYINDPSNWTFDAVRKYDGMSSFLQRISLILYPLAALRQLLRQQGDFRKEHKDDARLLMVWLSTFIIIILLLGLSSIPQIRAITGDFEQDTLGVLAILLLVHTLGYIVIARRSLQDGFILSRQSSDGSEDFKATAHEIDQWLQTEKAYLDSEMSLEAMAKALRMPRNMVSDSINIGLGTTFYDIMNRYRVAEFKTLAALPENKDKSVLELAYACGFNSKAAFYRAFRASEGMTPTEYRKSISRAS